MIKYKRSRDGERGYKEGDLQVKERGINWRGNVFFLLGDNYPYGFLFGISNAGRKTVSV